MSRPRDIREEIAEVCRRLWERGLIAGQDGNVSVRVDDGRLLVTPAGMSKCNVEPDDLVELAADGTHIAGAHRASSEVGMHLRIYELRPDVRAVVHAHPPVATGFAVAGEGLVADVLPEIIFLLGRVPLVPYATPGSSGVAEGLAPYIPNHDAFLLANHGATTVGPSLLVAHQRMESLEHAARILFTARQLGRVNPLTEAQVLALVEARDAASERAGKGAQTQAVARERVDPGDVHSGRSDANAGRRSQ